LDPELVELLQELYKILSEHTSSQVMKITHLLALSRISIANPQHWVTSYSALCQVVKLGGKNLSKVMRHLIERTVPLGAWDNTADILSSIPTWGAQEMAAEIMETRLGAKQEAFTLYQEALKLYQRQQVVDPSPSHLERQHNLQASLKRLSRWSPQPMLPKYTEAPARTPIFNPSQLPPIGED
jgi:hypothetical protein